MITNKGDEIPAPPADAGLLAALARGQQGSAEIPDGRAAVPKAPPSIGKTGLSTSFLLELVLKVIHYVEQPTADHLARVVCLPIKLVEELLESLKTDRLLDIIGGNSYQLSSNYRYRLTEKGEARAEQALERCRYAGAAPVTLQQYERVIAAGDSARWRPTVPVIREAFRELVLDAGVVDFLERALHSGRSAMIYGPSGNGKTTVLTEFVKQLDGEVLVPHAIYAYGQIIRVFDPLVHQRIDAVPAVDVSTPAGLGQKTPTTEDGTDRRWVRARRPGLVVGGEFTAESLELGYDPIARFYQAPKHMKAQGGVLVVDDFGRQKVSPVDLLNRWIMALERGRDNLLLRTGESIEVPFHITLLFSTNLNPADLADSAYLRRVPYKAYMPDQTPERFADILHRVLEREGFQVPRGILAEVAEFLNTATGQELSGSLARDLVTVVLDNAEHEENEPVFDVHSFELAYRQFAGIPEDAPLAPASLATTR